MPEKILTKDDYKIIDKMSGGTNSPQNAYTYGLEKGEQAILDEIRKLVNQSHTPHELGTTILDWLTEKRRLEIQELRKTLNLLQTKIRKAQIKVRP